MVRGSRRLSVHGQCEGLVDWAFRQLRTTLLFFILVVVTLMLVQQTSRQGTARNIGARYRDDTTASLDSSGSSRLKNNLVQRLATPSSLSLPPEIRPRAWTPKPWITQPWTSKHRDSLPPCYRPSDNWRENRNRTFQGLFFAKAVKTGGSTGVGIHLRIARNVARRKRRRYLMKQQSNSSSSLISHKQQQQQQPPYYQLCRARFNHDYARRAYANRDRKRSYLWTLLRDPLERLVSHFFFFHVSRRRVPPLDGLFGNVLLKETSNGSSHYNALLSLQHQDLFHHNPADYVNQMLQDYDFIGVTERMDESAVALSMLLNVPLADVLFLSSKGKGGFDDGGHQRQQKCVYIVPSFLTPGMRQFVHSEFFQRHIYWDRILHQAANASLDLTIDHVLGRDEFERKLSLFRKAQALARQRCLPQTVFPCSFDQESVYRKTESYTDCLWTDAGCGYRCLDQVATELELWGDDGPIVIDRLEGFNPVRELLKWKNQSRIESANMSNGSVGDQM